MNNTNLVTLSDSDGKFRGMLDPDSGKVFDQSGKVLFTMARDKDQERLLADYAATYDAQCIAVQTKRGVTIRDPSFKAQGNPRGERRVTLAAAYDAIGAHAEELRTLATNAGDLGPADVHIARGLPGYAAGYTLEDGVADVVAPPFLTPNQSDKFWTWNQNNQFELANPIVVAAGASPNEINPVLSNASFNCVPYALGSFITTDVVANADAPLQPMQAAVRMVMDKLKLAREVRVAALVQTTGNWNSNLVVSETAATKWNGGATSDPIADLHYLVEQTYMPLKKLVWSELVEHWFIRHPKVQQFFYAKNDYKPLPSGSEISRALGLPEIVTARMKYLPTQAGGLSYVWGNHVVGVRDTAALGSGQDVATARTFRWTGGPTPDGSAVGGWLVRTYFDPKRGARGGTVVVVSHYDAEVVTSNLVGGLLANAYQ